MYAVRLGHTMALLVPVAAEKRPTAGEQIGGRLNKNTFVTQHKL